MGHREALASPYNARNPDEVLSQVIKIVNHIKSNVLTTKVVILFCYKMDANHITYSSTLRYDSSNEETLFYVFTSYGKR